MLYIKLILTLKRKQMERKRAKVHMLPTEDKSIIFRRPSDSRLLFFRDGKHNSDFEHLKAQHLYITTDEEIKDCWYIRESDKTIHYCQGEFGADINMDQFSKIIASTDPKLTMIHKCPTCSSIGRKDGYMKCKGNLLGISICSNKETENISLPQPSLAFIKKYCELEGIDEVDVECEECCGDVEFCPDGDGFNCAKELGLKVDSHNTITIHAIKDSWSREEVERLLHLALATGSAYGMDMDEANAVSWIKENL